MSRKTIIGKGISIKDRRVTIRGNWGKYIKIKDSEKGKAEGKLTACFEDEYILQGDSEPEAFKYKNLEELFVES